MPRSLAIAFQSLPDQAPDTLALFLEDTLAWPEQARQLLGEAGLAHVTHLIETEGFNAKAKSILTCIMPAGGAPLRRVILIGLGSAKDADKHDWTMLGGTFLAAVGKSVSTLTLLAQIEKQALSPETCADIALGATLRAYSFDQYKTKKSEEEGAGAIDLTIATSDPSAARKAWKAAQAVAEGVVLARDLVNEPPNVLHPEAFANRAAELAKLGVEIEVLDEKALKKIGMRALLGVGQGSAHESRVVIMRWNGAKSSKAKPVAFIGKGVCFDTGGISIKPAASMEDMKGDMAGAAAVVGLMHTLAARKAKVNVVGAIGLVENMPDGKAQRPGDIVTSLSGQTIEIINTDAEGRLVLADVLWHINATQKPVAMINLATLTGAIIVSLGQHYAGVFSNDDTLSARLSKAGEDTGERVWRMPLDPEYDKLIDSKFADMKNSGGRLAGSITAAQFLKRFVGETPWAHIDIAGTAMGSPTTPISTGWASGYGVRLLDAFLRQNYEN